MAKPETIRICHAAFEGARFEHVGKLADGRQFIAQVTGAFAADERFPDISDDSWREKKAWVSVVHLFDPSGAHLVSKSALGGNDSLGRQVAS